MARAKSERFIETDNQILEVSRRLFSQSGIHEVEMKDICREIGCSRSTLYRHYDSKEAILFRLTGSIVDRLMAAAIIPPRKTFRSGFEALSWQLQMITQYLFNHAEEVMFMRDFDFYFTKALPETEEAQSYVAGIVSTRGKEDMLASIDRGIRDGSIRPFEDPVLVQYTLVNACIAMAQRILPRESVIQEELGHSRDMVEMQNRLLLEALKKP